MASIFEDCIRYCEGLAKTALEGTDAIVSIGGTTVQQPCEFLVRELPESVTFTDRVTSAMGKASVIGHYRVQFNVACEVWAKRPTLTGASFDVQSWVQSFFRAVAADKTLGGLCIHAEPYFGSAGTALDTNKRYLAAANCGLTIKAELAPAETTNDKE